MDDIQIFDNFLPRELFYKVQQKLTSQYFQWNLTVTTCDGDEHLSLARSFYDACDIFNYDYLQKTSHIIRDRFFPGDVIIRVRPACILRNSEKRVGVPHVDFNTDHYTALLYINENDGDTILYDEFYEEGVSPTQEEIMEKSISFNVAKKVQPKENRLVIFNGLRYHSSSTSTNTNARFVVNFNFEKPKEE
jgi:hypothetical protein